MIEDDDINFEEQENTDVDFIIDPVDESKKSLVYGLYAQLASFENFYSRIQNSYKRVSITWLIASFIGMGYLFSKKAGVLPIHPLLVLLFIAFATMWGITLLWFLDIIIYQTYFYGVSVEEGKLEKKNKWLPNFNINLCSLQSDPKKRMSQSYFYIGCHFILLLIMCLTIIFIIEFNIIFSLMIIIGFIAIGFVISYLMLRVEHPHKAAPIRKQMQALFRSKKTP